VFFRSGMTSAAEAGIEDKPFIAAVNRCATQRQRKIRLFFRKLLSRALPKTDLSDGFSLDVVC
jgi:hypothetical protein